MLSNGECDLHPQEHPIVDKVLRLNYVQSFGHGILDLERIGHRIPWNCLFLHFFFNWLAVFRCLLAFYHIDVHEVFPS